MPRPTWRPGWRTAESRQRSDSQDREDIAYPAATCTLARAARSTPSPRVMLVPLICRLVPPQGQACGAEAGKLARRSPSVTPSVDPLSPVATVTVTAIAAAAANACSIWFIAGPRRKPMEQAFAAAAAMAVTVTVATGDNGSTDGVTDGLQHADFPASAPHALACGGTSLQINGTSITLETVWNDGPGQGASGGGISDVFPIPDYQTSAGIPPSANPGGRVGRGIPDVCGDADPDTGYKIRVDGQTMVIGGTSAVAPLWAGLLPASIRDSDTPSDSYSRSSTRRAFMSLNDIVSGSNGAYTAGPGWDACSGLGSPDGRHCWRL